MSDVQSLSFPADAGALLARALRVPQAQTADEDEEAVKPPDDTWRLEGGWAWVWRRPGHDQLTRPVLIADGFGAAASKLKEWDGLWEESGLWTPYPEDPDRHPIYPWGTRLHESGRDVIVIGYADRSDYLRHNARVAMEAIERAQALSGGARLVVGGLSMGGIVTRYALALLEDEGIDRGVGTYFSYDSPHRGAWIPISLQTLAHFLAAIADEFVIDPGQKAEMKALSELMNRPAARELLWKHTETHKDVGPEFTADPARSEFVAALDELGGWPDRPLKLAVANGQGNGEGLHDVQPGDPNLVWKRKLSILPPAATLYAQSDGTDRLVAKLHKIPLGTISVRTSGIPALDGAPGGTLDSFGIAAEALRKAGYTATAEYPDVCFVPVGSAVDICDPSDPFSPVDNMDPEQSGLDEFKMSSHNEPHTLFTEELCDWLTSHFD